MEKLQEMYSKNGTDYKLIKRNDKGAMYQQFMDGVPVGYEVFIIRIQPAFKFPNGVINPEKEAFPGNENFGKTAWSFDTPESAEIRYNEITNGILKPVIEEIEPEILTEKPKRSPGRPRKLGKTVSPKKERAPKKKFSFEGKEYNSKSDVVKILLERNLSKQAIAKQLGITVQTVHAVFTKVRKAKQ